MPAAAVAPAIYIPVSLLTAAMAVLLLARQTRPLPVMESVSSA
ncbi:hypothetical protein GA0070613_5633 [Micromonospora inositola]|uniref:Uncharacterized protein n=1 Tax=Micromonospora inositola TaxID=47865 RepID=A0A1C5JWB8_9ACTN|nr:hypothetical protein GA0070613_5633 [Micromonospora inositola]